MIRACLAVTLTLASLALAAEPASPCSTTVPDPFFGDSTPREGLALPDGPISVGYFEADMATGRRTCPRTEVGIGGRFGAIIDPPNFYGNLGINGLIFGSYAVNEKTEVFATLEAVSFDYAVNASLSKTGFTLGNLTAGVTRVLYTRENFAGAFSGRLLLPTSFEIPGSRLIGAEVGHVDTWVPRTWLEVHTAVSLDFTAAMTGAQSFSRFGGTLIVGAELKPTSWFGFVVDANGHIGARSFLAPSAALRFRVASLGIELGGTLPVYGSDRHDFIFAGRFSWRF